MPEVSFQTTVSSLDDPDLTDNARRVLRKRYLIKDEDGKPVERPKDMFWRVARTIASEDARYGASDEQVDELAKEFYNMMAQGIWEPNSPTLTGAGRDLGMLSACFVLPVSDTLSNGEDGIYDTVRNAALIWQAGGGTGYSFSNLRPNGSMVRTTTGVASGPVSFMEIYDTAVETMKQGGHRRGAQMGILRVDHPDILEFIRAKNDTDRLTNFNISVAATEEFMQAVKDETTYELRDPRDGTVTGRLDAREVFNEIAQNAHATGEPGLFFIDRANESNPVPHLGEIESTNPCGEVPLLQYDVCNLGSLNLGHFVNLNDKSIEWEEMREYIHLGVRFLDNVIDANDYPLPEIRKMSNQIRRIGFGVMGWADMLIRLGIPYDSQEALDLADDVAKFVLDECRAASEDLAEERGPFPEFTLSKWNKEGHAPRRNSYVNVVAPTGTISIIAGCSGGIEPLYAVAFKRYQAGEEMDDINEDFLWEINQLGLKETVMEEVVRTGRARGVKHIPDRLQEIFATSGDIAPEWHVRMQAVWQEHTEQAISKTINLPEDAEPSDVLDAYMQSYRLGCKGITVYRDGSREGQALAVGEDNTDEEHDKEARPTVLKGYTRKQETPLGRAYVTINENGNRPFEVFVNIGKAGGSVNAHAEAMGRLMSLGLRCGIPMEKIHEELLGISSDRAIGLGPDKVHSLPDGIAQALGKHMDFDNGVEKKVGKTCPDCEAQLVIQEGCEKCASCGYSECG